MTDDGFYAYWYMPFGHSGAAIELVNDDQADRASAVRDRARPARRPFEGLGHFHAKWHRDTGRCSARTAGPTGPCSRPRAAAASAA